MKFEINIFLIAWFLGFGSFFLSIAEMIGVHTFSKFFYKIGLNVFHQSYEIGAIENHRTQNDIFKMSEGKFKFINNNECLFTSKLHLFGFFRFNTPFPFKGTAVLNNNRVDIYGRLPIGTTLFLMFWVIGWTVGSLHGDIAFSLIGWFFAGFMVAISLPIEKKRMQKMISELKIIIEKDSNQLLQPPAKRRG